MAEPTTLQEVAKARNSAKTTQLVGAMWEQTADLPAVPGSTDPFADWTPEDLDAAAASKRRIRWPTVGTIIVLAAAAIIAAWWLPQVSARRAATYADSMQTSLQNLYGDMADVQQALAVSTEPTSAIIDLDAVAGDLAGAADSAARLLDVANRPMPSPLPLSSRQPFNDLRLVRVGLEPLAAEASAIRSEVAAIADYRIDYAAMLQADELPLTADSATINDQAASLAKSLSASVAALALMPLDGPLAGHRTLLDAEVTEFPLWQDDYLQSLRSGDAGTTERLVEEFRATQLRLDDELIRSLAELRPNIDGRILDLAARLARAIESIP